MIGPRTIRVFVSVPGGHSHLARLHLLAKVGGFMLLHHLFKELVLIEVATSPDIWPIADRALHILL